MNYFIELLGSDFSTVFHSEHGGGHHVPLTVYGYYKATHLNISKFVSGFRDINVTESERPASKLDTSHLKNTVIKHCTDYFNCLIAMGVMVVSLVTIVQEPLVPAVVQIFTAAAQNVNL